MSVAGAGPVGLVLALSLARRGHRVTVVEKLVDLLDPVRGAGTIHAATLEMLDDIGLYERLAPRGLVAPLVHYWARGEPEPIAVFDHGVLAADTGFPHALQCDRLKVVEEALKMAAGDGLIEISTGSEFVGLRQDADAVTAVVQTADGERGELRGSHLVGCEGAHSVVRKQLGIGFEGFAFPDRTMTLSVVFDFDSVRPYGLRNYILDPLEWANLFKWTDVWRVVLPADVDRDPDALLDDGAGQAALQRLHPDGSPYEVVSKSLYTVHQRVAETFRAGRAMLAGDAAHVNSPIGAMGMNSGIHDAVNLADELSSVLRGEAGDEALDRYVRQRRHAAVAHVQAITIRNKRLMAETDPDERRRNRDELRRAADDPVFAREFLLRASLIQSVREAAEVPWHGSVDESGRPVTGGALEARLAALGCTLPEPRQLPSPNRRGCVRVGDMVLVSGHGPHHPGMDIVRRGKLGADLSVEQGYQAARASVLSILATLRAELGDLDRVRRVVRLLGMVNCTPEFDLMPQVIDGASDLFLELLGPDAPGGACRVAVACPQMRRVGVRGLPGAGALRLAQAATCPAAGCPDPRADATPDSAGQRRGSGSSP